MIAGIIGFFYSAGFDTGAAGALVLVEMRRRRRPDGLREAAGRLLRDRR